MIHVHIPQIAHISLLPLSSLPSSHVPHTLSHPLLTSLPSPLLMSLTLPPYLPSLPSLPSSHVSHTPSLLPLPSLPPLFSCISHIPPSLPFLPLPSFHFSLPHLHVTMMVFSPSQEGFLAMIWKWVVTCYGEGWGNLLGCVWTKPSGSMS